MQSPTTPAAPTSPLKALARRWPLGLVLGLVGLIVGAGVSWTVLPVNYVGEARVAVGSQSLDARAVAGYSQASQQLASDLARYVNDQEAQYALDDVMGEAASSVATVAASPIPQSSVIRVEVTGTDADATAQAAQSVAQSLTDQVNGITVNGPEELLANYTRISDQVAAQQIAVQNAQNALGAVEADTDATPEAVGLAQQQLAAAQSQLSVLSVQQQALGTQYRDSVTSTPAAAGLRIIREGTVTSNDRMSSAGRYGIAGLGLGLILALVIATARERRAPRAANPTTDARIAGEDVDVDVREHAGRN